MPYPPEGLPRESRPAPRRAVFILPPGHLVARESAEDILSKECEIQCEDVFLAISCYSDDLMSVSNKGNFDISKLRVQNSSGVSEIIVNILLDETKELNIGEMPISIVPIVGKDEEECVCGNRRLEVSECIS